MLKPISVLLTLIFYRSDVVGSAFWPSIVVDIEGHFSQVRSSIDTWATCLQREIPAGCIRKSWIGGQIVGNCRVRNFGHNISAILIHNVIPNVCSCTASVYRNAGATIIDYCVVINFGINGTVADLYSSIGVIGNDIIVNNIGGTRSHHYAKRATTIGVIRIDQVISDNIVVHR